MPMIATGLEPSTPVPAPAPPSAIPEAARYFIASLAALGLDAGLLWIGATRLDLPAWLAGAFAYGAGLVFIYVLSIRWVFRHRAAHDTRGEFVVFAVLGLVGLAVNSATLLVATDVGMALAWAKALSAGIGFITNFVSRKLLLFTARAS